MITAKIQKSQRWPPLRERIVRTYPKSGENIGSSFAASMSRTLDESSKLRGKTKEWTGEQMEKAIQDVTTAALGVRRAALEYQVPRSTLSDRITGRVCPGATPGAPKYLCEDEEEELVKWIASCAEVGYAKSVREIRAVVGAIVSNKLGLDDPIVVSHGWWDRFRQRHPHVLVKELHLSD